MENVKLSLLLNIEKCKGKLCHILYFVTKRILVVNVKPRPPYTRAKALLLLNKELGGPLHPAGHAGDGEGNAAVQPIF